jgi:hypothetical protein
LVPFSKNRLTSIDHSSDDQMDGSLNPAILEAGVWQEWWPRWSQCMHHALMHVIYCSGLNHGSVLY